MIPKRIDAWAIAGWFACLVLVVLPFAHTASFRNVSLGVAWLGLIVGWRHIDPPRVPLLWLFAAWGSLGLLSLVWALDVEYSAAQLNAEIVHAVLVFVLFHSIATLVWIERFRRTLLVAIALSLVSALIWSLFLNRGLSGAFFNGPGMYSTFLIGVYPFTLTWFLAPGSSKAERIVNGLSILAIVAGGAITLNRAFWIVLALETIAVIALLRGGARWLPMPKHRIAYACAAVIVFGGLFYTISTERLATDPAAPATVSESVAGDIRSGIWSHAVRVIAEHPLIGHGFGRGALRHEMQAKFGGETYWHAHNAILNYGLAMGIPGIVIILALFGVVFARMLGVCRSADPALAPYAIAATVMVAGMFVRNQADDLFYRQSALLYWAVAGMVLGASSRCQRNTKR